MLKANRLVIATGLIYLVLALGHIPVDVFPYGFDKNAPVHFVFLMIIAMTCAGYVVLRHNRFELPLKVVLLLWALVLAVLASTLNAPDLIGSLTGDSGRFTGAVSLFCLIMVAIYHSQFSLAQIHKLAQIYVTTIFIVSVIGLLQYYKVIDMPGDTGVTGTLGNLDFFGAYVGTGFALFVYLMPTVPRPRKILFTFFILVNLYAVYLAGPLQSYVDIAIILVAVLTYKFRSYIPRYDLTLNAKTFFGTLGVIIWLEAIFLMPFLGSFIPVLGNDVQVQIRGQFWLAATRQFFSSPLTGVGPDHYGSYYEQYRTILSVQNNPTLLANDAHAAPAQTLATLGILGIIAFVLLLALLIRGFCILHERDKKNRFQYTAIGIYLFVFTTNAAISPITLPHKYLFWALAGFIVGQAYKGVAIKPNLRYKLISAALIPALILPTIYVLVNFIPAQLDYLRATDKSIKEPTARMEIKYNNFLPCIIYYPSIASMVSKNSEKDLIIFSQDQIKGNPNCVEAWVTLAKIAYNQGDLPVMKTIIYELIEIAPSRQQVINFAALYANKAGDDFLDDLVDKQLMKLNPGLVVIE